MEEAIDSSKTTYKPFFTKQRIVVRKIPSIPRQNIVINLEKNIKTFFFIKQGASKATLTFDKDVYYPNEIARVACLIDNTQCEKDIERVSFKLKMFMRAVDDKNRIYTKNEKLCVARYPGLRTG